VVKQLVTGGIAGIAQLVQ